MGFRSWAAEGVQSIKNLFRGGNSDDDEATEGQNTSGYGFKMQKEKLVDVQMDPLILPGGYSGGGIQGLSWYVQGLLVDEDGCVAEQFLEENISCASEDEEAPRSGALRILSVGTNAEWRRVQIQKGDVLPYEKPDYSSE